MTTPNEPTTPQQLADAAAARAAAQDQPQPKPTEPAAQPVEAEPAATSEEQQTAEAGYQLDVPGDVPAVRAEDWRPVLYGFSGAASAAGIPQAVAQQLVEAFVDADVAIDSGFDEHFDYGDAEKALRGIWRGDFEKKIAEVQRVVRGLGTSFARWLDDSNMGNSPAVLLVLANYGDMRLTKAQAQAELNKIVSDQKSDYFSQDSWRRKPAVVRVKLLSRIANAEDAPVTDRRARAMNAQAERVEKMKASNASGARAEAQKMLADRNGPLMDSGHRDHKAAVARYHDLIAKL